MLLACSRFRLLSFRGTYFQLADYSAISDLDAMPFVRWPTVKKGIVVIPLSPFRQTPPNTRIARFGFAKQDQTLEQAAEILYAV